MNVDTCECTCARLRSRKSPVGICIHAHWQDSKVLRTRHTGIQIYTCICVRERTRVCVYVYKGEEPFHLFIQSVSCGAHFTGALTKSCERVSAGRGVAGGSFPFFRRVLRDLKNRARVREPAAGGQIKARDTWRIRDVRWDETFAGGSPLEAHGRFSSAERAVYARSLFSGAPAFRSGNLMLVACHANILSFIHSRRVFPASLDTRYRDAAWPTRTRR